MADSRPSITLNGGRRLHYSALNWDDVVATTVSVGGKSWPIGGLMRPARALQTATLSAFEAQGRQMEEVANNRDLTTEAKRRRMSEMLDAFAEKVNGPHEALAESMQQMHESALNLLKPTKALDRDDAVGAAMDAELRGILRNMESKKRLTLLHEARTGSHPELVAAMLRAPALASGVPERTLVDLRNAGIVATYPEVIGTIRGLMVNVHDNVTRTMHQAADTLLAVSDVRHHPAFARWRTDLASDLRAWISDLPMHRASEEAA